MSCKNENNGENSDSLISNVMVRTNGESDGQFQEIIGAQKALHTHCETIDSEIPIERAHFSNQFKMLALFIYLFSAS